MKRLRQLPFSKILKNRAVFDIFDQEFQKEDWLELSALLSSDCCIDDCYKDGTVPAAVLDEIVKKLDAFEMSAETSM
jgi:hypothetical protein